MTTTLDPTVAPDERSPAAPEAPAPLSPYSADSFDPRTLPTQPR